jgi:hypothetical protein
LTDIDQKTKHDDARSNTREEYARPELKVFGQVGALTQSGSNGVVEEGMEIPMGGMDMGMDMALDKARP